MSSDIKHNAEGYKDSTAYKAIMAIEETKKRKMKEQAEHDKLVQHIKYIVELAGFRLTDRVRLMNKESRRRYE
ncbi:hypothetical protein [Lachnoanaerobaculum saburreum]|jgi:hypothetical protein|uniref:Uncharacterized protein n=1 Tax=Lachnoanaerobaculum saburreum TaxID=467210 RepID=A0A133ZGB7_9FIRM|nr:hypothetical protein [Lachnoanaerobaculum saburreum]KXB54504.1 hypothetical protein HMPREF1866_02356 [Lachnoanaerobaculum saburreum]DAO21443.1 MAG TPA: hypothetical protein [Caudoviricetes sp.]